METKQTEVKQNGAKKPAPKKGKNPFRSNKFKRGGMATLMTVVFVAIVIVLNVVVSALAERFPSMDIDMTAQGLNTLSDQAIEIAQSIDEDTTIYLIGSEDAYENNQIYSSYGLEYSQVAKPGPAPGGGKLPHQGGVCGPRYQPHLYQRVRR